MKLALSVCVLLGSAAALRMQNPDLQKNLAETQAYHTCDENVDKIKKLMSNPINVSYYLSRSSKFTDPDFGHDRESLYWAGYNDDTTPASHASYVVWKRLSDSGLSGISMFGNEDVIAPHDIDQGSLGDCYYLSAAGAMAEYEDRFKSLFVVDELNSKGIYAFNVFVKGVPTELAIDDWIPGR